MARALQKHYLCQVSTKKTHLITALLMDSGGTFNLGGLRSRPRGALYTRSPLISSPSFLLPSPSLGFISYSSVTHLVGVDGHAGGEADHRDAVKARRVGDRRWSEVVIGLGRVTHQDSIDLQRHAGRTICHSYTRGNRKQQQLQRLLSLFVFILY